MNKNSIYYSISIQIIFFILLFNVISIYSKANHNHSSKKIAQTLVYNKHKMPTRPKKYVIGTWHCGMGSSLHYVLNNLAFCEKQQFIPCILWNKDSLYYNPEGFNDSTNVWEYYFKPASTAEYARGTQVSTTTTPDIFHIRLYQPSYEKRMHAHSLIQKYMHPNHIVQQKIDDFYNTHIAEKHTIAIHVRGTDKGSEIGLIKPENAAREALKHAHKNSQFFIASDEQKIIDRLRKVLKGRTIIQYDCYRSENNKPLHTTRQSCVAQCGEDVIVEMYLMSKCNLLVHTIYCNVSNFPLYLNPDLPNIRILG